MRAATNTLLKLMLGTVFGFALTLLFLIKPISESYEKKLDDKDSICTAELNFRDSIHRKNVLKILQTTGKVKRPGRKQKVVSTRTAQGTKE